MKEEQVYSTLAACYQESLKYLLSHGRHVDSVVDPTSIASNWGTGGRPTREILGYSFQIENPYSSLFYTEFRSIRLEYLFGLFIWTIAGSDEVEWLAYYHPFASTFSDDEKHLCGAFGKRLFKYKDAIDQIDTICERLSKDPCTRRAFCAICTPEDNITQSREYPCCIGIQYFVRDRQLHSITHMRAQSAFGVLPYDAFLFMCLQNLLADRLGVLSGVYHHNAGTFHLYESEIEMAERVSIGNIEPISLGYIDSSERQLKEIYAFELEVRNATLRNDHQQIESLIRNQYDASTFWGVAKVAFLLHSLSRLGMGAEFQRLNTELFTSLKKMSVSPDNS